MRRWVTCGLRWLLGGAVLFATSAGTCAGDALRDLSDQLSDYADEVDPDGGEPDDFWDWLDNIPL